MGLQTSIEAIRAVLWVRLPTQLIVICDKWTLKPTVTPRSEQDSANMEDFGKSSNSHRWEAGCSESSDKLRVEEQQH